MLGRHVRELVVVVRKREECATNACRNASASYWVTCVSRPVVVLLSLRSPSESASPDI